MYDGVWEEGGLEDVKEELLEGQWDRVTCVEECGWCWFFSVDGWLFRRFFAVRSGFFVWSWWHCGLLD